MTQGARHLQGSKLCRQQPTSLAEVEACAFMGIMKEQDQRVSQGHLGVREGKGVAAGCGGEMGTGWEGEIRVASRTTQAPFWRRTLSVKNLLVCRKHDPGQKLVLRLP